MRSIPKLVFAGSNLSSLYCLFVQLTNGNRLSRYLVKTFLTGSRRCRYVVFTIVQTAMSSVLQSSELKKTLSTADGYIGKARIAMSNIDHKVSLWPSLVDRR